jgi:hypothetical protein
MSTTLVAIVIALIGVLGVLAVSWTFYAVGRSEDADRAAEAGREETPPEPEPDPHAAPHTPAPHGESPERGRLARERSRRRPPRRPR